MSTPHALNPRPSVNHPSGQRRRLGSALLLASSMLALSPWALAQNAAPAFPAKPIRWVVVAPAGSSLDVIARAMQDKLKDRLAQPIVIENKPQAGGTLGVGEVARSAPDGHTWVLGFNGPLAFAPFLYKNLSYRPLQDLAPVILTTSQPNVIAVNAQVKANSLAQWVDELKARPGHYNYASVGNGSSSHLTMEYLKALTGTFAVHIPFNGGPPAVLSVLGGDTQALATVPTVLISHIKSGKLKAIATTGNTRYALLPDVLTVAESGIPALAQFEALAWNGVLVAAGTPAGIVNQINTHMNAVLKDPQVQDRLKAAGLDPVGGSAQSFGQLMASEAQKWQPIIVRSGAKLD